MSTNHPREMKGQAKQSKDPFALNANFKLKGKQGSNTLRKTSHPQDFTDYNKELCSGKFELSSISEACLKTKKNSFYKYSTSKNEVDPFVFMEMQTNTHEVSSNHLSSHDFYKHYLSEIKNIQNFTFDKEVLSSYQSENIEPNHHLNESFSTTHSAYASTIQTPKKQICRQASKIVYDGYLNSNYPEIYNIQQKFSSPYTIIEVKKGSIYFIIKSFNIENIHKSIKYGVWSTTYSGNIIFDKAFALAQSRGAEVYLFFSTNSTFAFQGIARLRSKFQTKTYSFWKGSEKYKSFNGSFNLDWVIIKDVPNSSLDIIQVNNIPFSKLRNGVELNENVALNVVNIFRNFYYCSSLVLSDFMRLDIEEKVQVQS